MSNEHSITPSPELVQRLRSEAPHGIRDAGVTRELHLITTAYRAGADQELEACCAAEQTVYGKALGIGDWLRALRRPKPPSLADQALEATAAVESMADDYKQFAQGIATIRTALERLKELEASEFHS